jgi:hypothetical protein
VDAAGASIPIIEDYRISVRAGRQIRPKRTEKGIALLIAIFILLLISVVAIALIVSSGTESALAGNYRSSTGVYYAALAGLEEVRGRLLVTDPNAFATTNLANFLPPPGTDLAIGDAYYLINPFGGESITPWDSASAYPDNEFGTEFSSTSASFSSPSSSSKTALSVWNRSPLNSLSFPGPLYKWVRINAVSEKSLKIDVDNDTLADSITPLYYDGAHFSNSSSAGPQVLELTSLAVLPNGSQKLLQYLVAPNGLSLSFPAALTLDGPVGTFNTSGNSDFFVSGIDRQHGSPYPGTCPPNDPTKYGVGATSSGDRTLVVNQISNTGYTPLPLNYRGILPHPSIGDVGTDPGGTGALISAFQSVNSLDGPQGVVQFISASANQSVTGPANSLPDMGALNRLVTTVVQGDLTLTGTMSGYGLLVVTGNLTLGGHVSWYGVILVIGQGHLFMNSYGAGEIDGAVLVARTRHNDGSLRATLGLVEFDITNANFGNGGLWYNSCWIQAVLPSGSYKILSFHEIAQ